MPSLNACTLGIVAYPRTGKRGVPQQFPRRLYEMLEGESSKIEGENCDPIIAWSDSGKAFRIIDARMFSSDVLPRYFRTSKFSSFQRNLNLYGFTKVCHGPDTDMYAHPSFIRGYPELLSALRKGTSTSGRKRNNSDASSTSGGSATNSTRSHSRAVSTSPPCSPNLPRNISVVHSSVGKAPFFDRASKARGSDFFPRKIQEAGAGRLDILAMALISLADQDLEPSVMSQEQQV